MKTFDEKAMQEYKADVVKLCAKYDVRVTVFRVIDGQLRFEAAGINEANREPLADELALLGNGQQPLSQEESL